MGWIGPLMKKAGFVIDHEHNHCGQCWWEMRSKDNPSPTSSIGELSGDKDVRLRADWQSPHIDQYARATDPDDKQE